MAEEPEKKEEEEEIPDYLGVIDAMVRKMNAGESVAAEAEELRRVLDLMQKKGREEALKSPILTVDQSATIALNHYNAANAAFLIELALTIAASYIPLTNAGAVLAKAFDAPAWTWRLNVANKGIAIKWDAYLMAPLTRYYNKTYLPNVVDVGTAVKLLRVGHITEPEFFGLMAEHGYSGEDAISIVTADRIIPGLQDLMKMYRRGWITPEVVIYRLEEAGYARTDAQFMLGIQDPIPGSGDLVSFVVKEAFPLDKLPAAPAEFAKYMKMHGYADQWSRAYWFAHWRLVPQNTVIDLFHRGYLTSEEAGKYLILHDFPTFERPGQSHTDTDMIVEASYSLLPRIDLRFGWFTGALSEEEIEGLYRKYGFRESDAVKQIAIQKARVLDIYRKQFLATLRLAYRRHKISKEDFTKAVVAEKFPPDVAAWIIKSEDLRSSLGAGVESTAEERALTKADLIRLFKRGIIKTDKLKAELTGLTYASEEIDLLIKDAEYAAPTIEKPSVKELSLSQIEDSYKRLGWAEAQVLNRLVEMGYPELDRALLLNLWKLEISEAEAKRLEAEAKAAIPPVVTLSVANLKMLYRRGFLGADKVTEGLKARNYDEASIVLFLQLWDAEIAEEKLEAESKLALEALPAKKVVSLSVLEGLYKRGLRGKDLITKDLIDRDFTDESIALLVQKWDIDIAAKPSRIPTQGEARSMFEQGVIDTAAHKAILVERGLSVEWADRVVEAEERAAIRSEVEALIRHRVDLVKEGLLTGADVHGSAMALGLGAKLADLWKARAESEAWADRVLTEKKEILKAYEKDLITAQLAQNMLVILGMDIGLIPWELKMSDMRRGVIAS